MGPSLGRAVLFAVILAVTLQLINGRQLQGPPQSPEAEGSREESSCYDFGLAQKRGSSFGQIKSELKPNGLTHGDVWGVVHRCYHGILYPQTGSVKAVDWYLDDAERSGSPKASRHSLMPYKVDVSALKPGLHSLTVRVTFADSFFIPLVQTRKFRVPQKPKVKTLGRYGQCGGRGGRCKEAGSCQDAPYPSSRCGTPSFVCKRMSIWYWQCVPPGSRPARK